MVLQALRLALTQGDDRRFGWIALKSLLATIVVFAALWWTIDFAVDVLSPPDWPEFLDALLAWPGVLVVLWFAGPATFATVTGLFLEEVADAVEARHYPDEQAPAAPILRSVNAGVRLLGVSVLLNLALLPFAFLPPPLNLAVYIVAHGYVLGREYFEIVALRHGPVDAVRRLRRRRRGAVTLVGMAAMALSAAPILQLVAPIFGAAAMTHLFHGIKEDL